MTHEELKIRIRNMKHMGLLRMSPSNFALLTDDFCEELVRYILVNGETNERQRELINVIKDKYGEYRKEIGDVTWGGPFTGKKYPEYMNKLDFEIDCGDIIKDDSQMIGSWDTEDITNLYLTHDVIEDKLIQNEDQMTQDIYNQLDSRIAELEAELKSRDDKIAEKDTKIASLQQLLEQKEFRSTKPEDATLKEEIERLKQKREDMLVELLRPSFIVEADARSFVRKIDNGMDSDGVAEVARRYYLDNKIIKSKRGRSLWEILHAAKLYDKVEQSWTREMRKAD